MGSEGREGKPVSAAIEAAEATEKTTEKAAMGSTVSYELTDEKNISENEGDLVTKGCTSTTYRLGAGKMSWGEGFIDPSDGKRGYGDTDTTKYDLKDLENMEGNVR